MHLDWGASQFLTKQVQIGLVGYLYDEVSCDSGSGDHAGCFESLVAGIGPQIGSLFPIAGMQGYLHFKAYAEFDAADRPSGWNARDVLDLTGRKHQTTPLPPMVTK
jgi:hypothetical protein